MLLLKDKETVHSTNHYSYCMADKYRENNGEAFKAKKLIRLSGLAIFLRLTKGYLLRL